MTHVALRDPVDGSTFHSIACAAPLLRTLSEEHRITIREIYLMIRLELFGLPGLNEDWNPDCELENRTIDARRDARRLRELREEGGGTLEELVAILERSREGLKWLARFDPSRAKEVAAALEASEQRIRKTMCDHISSVRKQQEQGSTFFAHIHSDAGGRFATVGAQTVVGQTPNSFNWGHWN